jgi:hypothetical protein
MISVHPQAAPGETTPMLTLAENELLTRVGAGTPMGTLMRCFW